MKALHCYFCGGLVKPRAKRGAPGFGFLEIYSQELEPFEREPIVRFNEHGGREEVGALSYPTDRGNVCGLAIFTHVNCGPDSGYTIPFDRLGESDWVRHLRQKTWWFPEIDDALALARKLRGVRVEEHAR